jgi:hypothetical protein
MLFFQYAFDNQSVKRTDKEKVNASQSVFKVY